MALDQTAGSITEPQAKFMLSLAEKKDLSSDKISDEQRAYLLAGDYSAMSKFQADKAIKLLLQLNDKPVEPAIQDLVNHDATRLPSGATDYTDDVEYVDSGAARADNALEELAELEEKIDAGHYFIVDPTKNTPSDPNGGEMFFKVSKPTEGRWAGRTFLESRGSDYLYPVRDVGRKIAVYTEILKDPINAMNEYGIRLGVCGCCGRTLTARDSRLRGIGPICAERLMMQDAQATLDQVDMLRQLGLKKD